MDIVLMGAPGAGKGTQAAKLEKELGLKHISTGDVLRDEIASGSELGKRIAAVINNGDLVSDELMLSVLKNIVAGTKEGIIFDGFPRTITQAKMLDAMLVQLGRKLSKAVAIELPEEVVVERLGERKQCKLPDGEIRQSGPDFSQEDCQKQGGEIFMRPDDTPEHVRHRLAVYHQQTEPVIQFYRQNGLYAKVDGNQDPQQVFESLLAVIKQ